MSFTLVGVLLQWHCLVLAFLCLQMNRRNRLILFNSINPHSSPQLTSFCVVRVHVEVVILLRSEAILADVALVHVPILTRDQRRQLVHVQIGSHLMHQQLMMTHVPLSPESLLADQTEAIRRRSIPARARNSCCCTLEPIGHFRTILQRLQCNLHVVIVGLIPLAKGTVASQCSAVEFSRPLVRLFVQIEIGLGTEGVAAHLTLVWLFVSMDHTVIRQRLNTLEFVVAMRTEEILHVRIRSPLLHGRIHGGGLARQTAHHH